MKNFKTYNVVILEQVRAFCDEKTHVDVLKSVILPDIWRIQLLVNESIRKAIDEQTTRN